MKSSRHVYGMQAFMLVVSFLVLCMPITLAQKSGAEPFGLALSVKGEVLLTRGDIEFEAKIEESLFYEDAIETGEDGHLIISFGSSFISVGPNTSFSMSRQKVKNGKELIVVNLEAGKFRSKILNLGKNEVYQVMADTGAVTVYGTDLVTGCAKDSKNPDLSVAVLKGKVGVFPYKGGNKELDRQKPVLLRRQESASMSKDGKSPGVTNLTAQDVQSMKRTLPIPGDEDEDSMFFAQKKDKPKLASDGSAKTGGFGGSGAQVTVKDSQSPPAGVSGLNPLALDPIPQGDAFLTLSPGAGSESGETFEFDAFNTDNTTTAGLDENEVASLDDPQNPFAEENAEGDSFESNTNQAVVDTFRDQAESLGGNEDLIQAGNGVDHLDPEIKNIINNSSILDLNIIFNVESGQ